MDHLAGVQARHPGLNSARNASSPKMGVVLLVSLYLTDQKRALSLNKHANYLCFFVSLFACLLACLFVCLFVRSFACLFVFLFSFCFHVLFSCLFVFVLLFFCGGHLHWLTVQFRLEAVHEEAGHPHRAHGALAVLG